MHHKGHSIVQMWLGLRAKPPYTSCESAEACSGLLEHHQPGETSESDDDITSDFVYESWITTVIDVRNIYESNRCLTMKRGGQNDDYKITPVDCLSAAEFYCKLPCSSN